jgi:hypothetical protein
MPLTGTNYTIPGANTNILADSQSGVTITTLRVSVESSSPSAATFRIPQLHGNSGVATLEPGQTELFRVTDGGIRECFAGPQNAIIRWWPVAVT